MNNGVEHQRKEELAEWEEVVYSRMPKLGT